MDQLTLNEAELQLTLDQGEFPESVRNAAERVVVVMTQDWCPQWHDLASWIDEFSDRASIYSIVYNTHPRFAEIMSFKENTFKNREIPYIRVYYKGELMGHANWMPKRTFQALLERTSPLRQ